MTTSACGFAFSASSFAVMTPVESRTHLRSMFGYALLKRFLVGLDLVGLERRVDDELGLLRDDRRGNEDADGGGQGLPPDAGIAVHA